jgi:uncharacterized protein YprB with RNaseH-like and TPR domain
MLTQTFCHLPRVGLSAERRLWESGVGSWSDCNGSANRPRHRLADQVEESRRHLDAGNAGFFAATLPANQQWRLYREFRSSTAYIDIETTGLGGPGDHITTIALYDGKSVRHYIHGQNLDQFGRDIADYSLIITYNGKCFDVPFIRRFLGVALDHAHVDLRYVLKSLGYMGGLKGCEKQLGLSRGDLDGIDGYFAVVLWHEYRRYKNMKALETLLAYNIQDVLTLETLMIIAYNAKLKETPFFEALVLSDQPQPPNPFEADRATVDRLQCQLAQY